MKFMDKNKDYVQVGDDFEILIRNRPIPGSDFIEIMNYLQKGPGAKEHTFIPTRDPGTGMPVGMRRFIDALHEAIEGEPILGDMDAGDVNKFAKKLSEFAGLKMDGVEEIVKGVIDDRGRRVGEFVSATEITWQNWRLTKQNKRKNRIKCVKYFWTWKPKRERFVRDKLRRQLKERETNGENKRSLRTQC